MAIAVDADRIIVTGGFAARVKSATEVEIRTPSIQDFPQPLRVTGVELAVSPNRIIVSFSDALQASTIPNVRASGLGVGNAAGSAVPGAGNQHKIAFARTTTPTAGTTGTLRLSTSGSAHLLSDYGNAWNETTAAPAAQNQQIPYTVPQAESGTVAVTLPDYTADRPVGEPDMDLLIGSGRHIINLDAANEVLTLTARDGTAFGTGDVTVDFGVQKPWLDLPSSISFKLPWDGTPRTDHLELDAIHSGDDGVGSNEVPSGSWIAYAVEFQDLRAAVGSAAVIRGRASTTSSRVLDIIRGRFIYVNGWVSASGWQMNALVDADNLVFPLQFGPLARLVAGRNRVGRRTGGLRVQVDIGSSLRYATVILNWDPAAALVMRDMRITWIGGSQNAGLIDVYGTAASATGGISLVNPGSDIDLTWESVPKDHGGTTFVQVRPRFSEMSHGAGRRLDITLIDSMLVLLDRRFGVTSLTQVCGTVDGSIDHAQFNLVVPTSSLATVVADYAPVVPPIAGTGKTGSVRFGGTSASYYSFVNPRLDPARVVLQTTRSIGGERVEMLTDLNVRAISGAGVDTDGALVSAFNGTGAGRTSVVAELASARATLRRKVFSITRAFADGIDTRTVDVRIRRADLMFAERTVAVDTTVGANTVEMDVRADPSFTGTPAAAALLDYDGATRRFAVIEDTLATGVPRRRIIVYADSTLQQLYDWLKWEYSRAALPRQGDVSARPDRHDEALPVELAGGTLMLTRGWQIDISPTAELSPAANATALSLSSPYDHASPAWAATAGRTYTVGTVVTHLDKVWYCIQAAPVAQVPGSAATYWVDVTAVGTVNYLVDGQNTGRLAATISLTDATGRTLTVVTEPGASYAYAETAVRERLRVARINDGACVLDSYDIGDTAATPHTEDRVTIPRGDVQAITRDPGTNDWIVGTASGSGQAILHRYDSVGHFINASPIIGFAQVRGLDWMDEGRLAVAAQNTNGIETIGIVDPRRIGERLGVPMEPAITIPASSVVVHVDGIAWSGSDLCVLVDTLSVDDYQSAICLRVTVGANNALAIDWTRSFRVDQSTSDYDREGVAFIGDTLHVLQYTASNQSLGAYAWPSAVVEPTFSSISHILSSLVTAATRTFQLLSGTDDIPTGLEYESRRVTTGAETTGTADSDGGFRLRATQSQVEPFMVACKKRGFDARGQLILPTVTRQLMSLSENPNTSPTMSTSAWSVTEETAAARPTNNIYLELNDPAASRQSVLRYADTRVLRGNPTLAKAVYDAVMTTPAAMVFWLRYFLSPSSHNRGQVFSIHDNYINVLQPYLRLARKAGLTNAKSNAGIAFYGGDNRTLIDPDEENGGIVVVPTAITVINLSPAGDSGAAETIIQDPRAINDLSNHLVPLLTAGVDALTRLEREVALRGVTGVGDPGYATQRQGLLDGASTFTIPGETTIRWLVEPVERDEAITVPLRDHPSLAAVVSSSATTGWSFRAWVADATSAYASGPLAAPTGTPLIEFIDSGGQFHRASTRRDTRWIVIELSNTATLPLNVTVTGFRLTSSLAYDPIEERIADSQDETRTASRPITLNVNPTGNPGGPAATATVLMGGTYEPSLLTPRSLSTPARGRLRIMWPTLAGNTLSATRFVLTIQTLRGIQVRETIANIDETVAAGGSLEGRTIDFHPTTPFDRVRATMNIPGTGLRHDVEITVDAKYNLRELSEDYNLMFLDQPISQVDSALTINQSTQLANLNSRLTATRATNLDNLDAQVSTRARPSDVPTATANADAVWTRDSRPVTALPVIADLATVLARVNRIRFHGTTGSEDVIASLDGETVTHDGNVSIDTAALATALSASVWTANTRTLTDLGTIPAAWVTAIWAATVRSLTGDVGLTTAQATQLGNLNTRLTATRASNLDNLDTRVSTISGGGGGGSGLTQAQATQLSDLASRLTAARAASLDDVGLTTAQATQLSDLAGRLTTARAEALDDVGLTQAQAQQLTELATRLTDTRAANLDNLDATVSSRPATVPTVPQIVAGMEASTVLTLIGDDAKVARKFATNRQVRSAGNSNLVTYDDDGTTPLRTHGLKGQDGTPAGAGEVYEQDAPTGSGSGT